MTTLTKQNLMQTVGHAAGELAMACKQTGLSWDESIAMLGLAAKVLSTEAKLREPDFDCHDLGKRRLNEGFSQSIDLKFATSTSKAKH